MATRFQGKGGPSGRLTPSNPTASNTITNSTLSIPSLNAYANVNSESDQAYLDRIKAREIISDALLQVTRLKPDNPIDFLYNYFESQCQTDPYEKTLTRLRLADPKHPSFHSLLVELYSNFDTINDDGLLLKGDTYNKLLHNLCNNEIWSGLDEHRTTLISLLSLRSNDAVSFTVFKYGIQAILLAKEFHKTAHSLYNSLANHAGSNTDVDRSLCDILLQMLSNSLELLNKAPVDTFSLHESIVKLSPHQVKHTLEQRWSPSRASTSKTRMTFDEFQTLAMSIYLTTIKKMSSLSYADEAPVNYDEYDYAGDEMNDEHVEMYGNGDEDSDDDDDEQRQEVTRNNHATRDKSQTSLNDDANLIDYVVEEEKEIGGTKGEDSYLTSRSTTYSSLISDGGEEEEDEEEEQSVINEVINKKKAKITAKEEGQMIRARAFITQLDLKVQEKDDAVQQIRQSIYLTKEKITKMEQNKTQLETNIAHAQDQRNVTIVNRLSSELNRVEHEIILEHDVLKDLQEKLGVAEMHRTRAIVERGRYNAEDSLLREKETILIDQKQSLVQLRQRQEDWKVTQLKRAHQSTLNTQKQALEQQAAAQRFALDEARRSKKVAHKYLQQTFEKVRTEKRIEEDASRAETERKIKSLLNLRNAIERNKDAITIKLAQKRAQERDSQDAKKREQQSIETEGQNGLFYMLRKERNEKLEQMQKRFADQQEQNRLVIVDKILKEENEKERKRKLYPELYKTNTKPSMTKAKDISSQVSQ
ncbi:unnamed protein product [Adineta ricciae]|nr:unnamed protein product [Adineta ricciae]